MKYCHIKIIHVLGVTDKSLRTMVYSVSDPPECANNPGNLTLFTFTNSNLQTHTSSQVELLLSNTFIFIKNLIKYYDLAYRVYYFRICIHVV